MIFFFFTSSVGLLEPELASFKDLEEIGKIWEIRWKPEISGKSVRNQWEISEKSVGASATLREIFQMSPISSKSSNGANSGFRGPREELKKKKNHQNLIPDMMGAFLDGPAHSKCLEIAKKRRRPQRAFLAKIKNLKVQEQRPFPETCSKQCLIFFFCQAQLYIDIYYPAKIIRKNPKTQF